MIKEEKALRLEDMKFLIEKVHMAMQAGEEIMLICNNLGVSVTVYNIQKTHEDMAPLEVFLIPVASVTTRDVYNECIAYIEKLAGEKCDN